MSLKEKVKGGRTLGSGNLPPILKMTDSKGSEFRGTFEGYKHLDKEVGSGRSKQMRAFDVFTFKAIEAAGGLTVTAGESYSIFASGHLRHLLAEVMEKPAEFVGREFVIGYKGTEKIKKGAFKGKDSHQFEVTIGE
jgi:hypothetical protein